MGEACTCHPQILPFDWRVPTAAVEVQLALVQALRLYLRHGVAMHNLHSINRSVYAYWYVLFYAGNKKWAERTSFAEHHAVTVVQQCALLSILISKSNPTLYQL